MPTNSSETEKPEEGKPAISPKTSKTPPMPKRKSKTENTGPYMSRADENKKKRGIKSENKEKKEPTATGGYSPRPISIVVQPGQEIRIICKGPPSSSLCFDDGGDPTVTPSIKSP